jgi:transcriptional regulator with XRE-family HTH domain
MLNHMVAKSRPSNHRVDEEIRPLGQAIKRLREAKDMTLDDLEETSGIDRNTISRYENLKVNPTATALLKLARGLDVNVSELMKALDHKPDPEAGEG